MAWTTSFHSLDDASAQARWQALEDVSPQQSFFSSLIYAQAVMRTFRLRCEMVLTASADRDEAGLLVFWRKRGPYRIVVIPPFTPYSAMVLRRLPKEADVHFRRTAFEGLLASLEQRYHLVRCACHALPDIRPALWRGWRAKPFYSYLLPLSPSTTLLEQWSGGTRRDFQRHVSRYVVAEKAQAAPALVSLTEAAYRRHGRDLPVPATQLLTLLEALRSDRRLRLFTATLSAQQSVEACAAVCCEGTTARYWLAGSVPGSAMTVLVGQLLTQLQAEGFQLFDFVGANTPSIAEFKRHFGPTLRVYYHLDYIARPELRLLHFLRDS